MPATSGPSSPGGLSIARGFLEPIIEKNPEVRYNIIMYLQVSAADIWQLASVVAIQEFLGIVSVVGSW